MKLKKSFIAFYIFLITAPIQAVNLNPEGIPHPPLQVYIPPISYNSWGNDFYKYLMNSESVEMRAVGIALFYANNHTEYEPITKYLNKLLPQKLNKESLYILRNVCHKLNTYNSTCEKHNYYNRLVKSDPQNLNLYIKGLFQYEKSNNPQQVNELTEKVKESTHVSSYNGYFMKDLKRELTNFFKLDPNPLYKPHPLFEKNHIKISASEKNETIINKLAQMFNQRFPSEPYYHYFLGECDNKLTKDEIELCNHVIDVLINKSDSESRKSVGYNFQVDMELANQDFRSFENAVLNNAVIAHSKIKLTSNCESNPGKTDQSKDIYRNYKIVHPLYLNIVIENSKEFGLEKASKLGYLKLRNYLVANKRVSPESLNNCEEINKLPADELYMKFKDDSQGAYILKKYKNTK